MKPSPILLFCLHWAPSRLRVSLQQRQHRSQSHLRPMTNKTILSQYQISLRLITIITFAVVAAVLLWTRRRTLLHGLLRPNLSFSSASSRQQITSR